MPGIRHFSGGTLALAGSTIAGVAALPVPAFAQGELKQNDSALSGVQVLAEDSGGCTNLMLDFTSRVQLVSSFPHDSGRELHVRVLLLDPQEAFNGRESLTVPQTASSLRSIEYEGDNPTSPTVSLVFAQDMHFQVSVAKDAHRISIALGQPGTGAACTAGAGDRPGAGKGATPGQIDDAARITGEAELALRDGKIDLAIQQLASVLAMPETPSTPRALELLGLARERAGQPALARTHYEEYLRRFPGSDNAETVHQRLAALPSGIAAAAEPALHAATGRTANTADWKWGLRGNVSSFYFRDQGRTTTLNTSSTLNQTVDNSVNVNQLLSTADVTIAGGNDRRQLQIRAAGAYTQNFGTSRSQIDINQGSQTLSFSSRPGGGLGSLTALYLDYADSDEGASVRIGRQNRNSAGVLGRFDGGLLGLQLKPKLRINFVGGFPVDSSHQLYVKTDRPFVGVSVDLGNRRSPLQASLYWFDQHATGGFIDRRSIGAELRYLHKRLNAFALIDYDVKLQRLNLGIVTLNYAFPDSSNLSVTADYRQSPLLRTTNILGGGGFTDLAFNPVRELENLRPFFTDAQIYQGARDNTLASRSVTVNYSRPLTAKFQLSADFNMTDTGGTKGILAPPGIAADPATGFAILPIPATGKEFYYGMEVIGSGLFQENDIYTLSGRYADTATATIATIDGNARIPVTRNFRVNPRLRYGYRKDKITLARPVPGSFSQFQPTMRFNYYPRQKAEFEIEFGGNFSRTRDFGSGSLSTIRETGWVLNAGFRLDF